MKVVLTGATGFVGTQILRELLNAGHTARCLVRPGSEAKLFVSGEGIETVNGDITRAETLTGVMGGSDAVIHLVGNIEVNRSKGITYERIIYEGSRNVADAARAAGIRQLILMSANGASEDGVSEYQIMKWRSEQYVKNAGFDWWTIFRPSIIFGKPEPDQPEFVSRLAETLIRPFPILPVFGSGRYRMQPISLGETARVFVQALTNEKARNKTYCVGGLHSFEYIDILDIITRATGRKPKPKIRQPVWLSRILVNTAGRVGLIPIQPDQFEMLLVGNECDCSALYADFDIDYKPFTPENLDYVRDRSPA
jgi:uncharacterized protein YbjT (DUF2867 family)